MAFVAIFDVVKKLLEETIPENVHPILALAKTDQEKKSKRDSDGSSDDEDGTYFSHSKSERVAWIRQCYKKPIASAGVRRPALADGAPPQLAKSTASEIECEKARERRLRRQATQGVVALFNAVRQHQSAVEKQLDASAPLLLQKEKVVTGYTASDFLDRLSAGLPGSKPKTLKTDYAHEDGLPPKKRRLNPFPVS